MTSSDQAPPPEAIFLESLVSYWRHLTIRAVAEMGLADHLKEGPLTVEALAAKADAHAPTLYRIMRALTDPGIFAEPSPRTFALTPVGELLRSDLPSSFHSMSLG